MQTINEDDFEEIRSDEYNSRRIGWKCKICGAAHGWLNFVNHRSGCKYEEAYKKVQSEIKEERQRQIGEEGFSVEHDDQYLRGELLRAASCYVLWQIPDVRTTEVTEQIWPWNSNWFKPKDTRRDLIRAAALIAAEIERLDREKP